MTDHAPPRLLSAMTLPELEDHQRALYDRINALPQGEQRAALLREVQDAIAELRSRGRGLSQGRIT